MASTSTDNIEDLGLSTVRSSRSNGARPTKKRLLGAYYTPSDVATSLATWALAPGIGTVLDPSFGGCAFLSAAASALSSKGVNQPGRYVFGVDIDKRCSAYVRDHPDLVMENCVFRDFLTCSPRDLRGAPFGAIVGNPPFVRNHWLKGAAQVAARASARNSGVPLPKTASSWAYFLIHSLGFIADGGRLAMLVPEAILQTDYGASVRRALRARFHRVRLVHIRNRLFDGTDESVVVVAATGYGTSGTLTVESIQCCDDLDQALDGSQDILKVARLTTGNGRIADEATVKLLAKLEQHSATRLMAEIAIVRIGLVTGANRHFMVRAEDMKRLRIPHQALKSVVTRTGWLLGLEFTARDHLKCVEAGGRAYLVYPEPDYENDAFVKRWIAAGNESGISEGQKCSARDPWFRVVLPPKPDAFATCTRIGSPLLVLNRSGCLCSNALHGVRWREETAVSPEAAVVGFLTSAVSVWAELQGRRYGGGVLKLEPSTLNRVPVPIWPDAKDAYEELDELMRAGLEEKAREVADTRVLGQGLGLSQTEIRGLQLARADLMTQRRPIRNRAGRA